MSTKPAVRVGGVLLNPFEGILALPFMFGRDRAACADPRYDPELWHPITLKQRRREEREAIRICLTCPLLDGCREWALEHAEHGIWGAMTEHKRTRIRHQREAVT